MSLVSPTFLPITVILVYTKLYLSFIVFNWNVKTIRRSSEDISCNISCGFIDAFFLVRKPRATEAFCDKNLLLEGLVMIVKKTKPNMF